jgi:hypothetical protein
MDDDDHGHRGTNELIEGNAFPGWEWVLVLNDEARDVLARFRTHRHGQGIVLWIASPDPITSSSDG